LARTPRPPRPEVPGAPGGPSRPSLARTAFTGAAWLAVLNGLGGIAVFALIAWLNRMLPDAPAQLSLWFPVFTLLLLVTLLFELGVGTAIMQRPAMEDAVLGQLGQLLLLQGVLGSVVVWLLAAPFARLSPELPADRAIELVRLAAPIVLLICAGMPPKALMQRNLRFREVAAIESGSTLLYVVVGALMARRWGLEGLVAATAARHLLETVIYWRRAGFPARELFRLHSWRGLGETVRFAAGMAGQGVIGSAVRQGDVYVVLTLFGQPETAIYRQVVNFVQLPFSRLLVHVNRAAVPTFAKVQDDVARTARGLQRMQRLAALLLFPALAGLAAVAPRLLSAYLGPQYGPADLAAAVRVTWLLCLGGAAYTYAYSSGVVINAAGHSGAMLLRQAVAAVAVFGFMIAGARHGFAGLAAGRTLAGFVTAGLFLDLARRRLSFDVRAIGRTLKEALPASLILLAVVGGAGWLAGRAWPQSAPGGDDRAVLAVLAGQVALGVIAYPLVLLLFGVNPTRDVLSALRRRKAG
jgi:O-antigen/teichoic acid export membrane protein